MALKRSPMPRATKPLPRGKPLKAKRGTSAAAAKRKADAVWSEFVKARDGRCLVCGRTEGRLNAHHVLIRSFNATRTDDMNGVTACFHCHQDKLHGDPAFAVAFYTRHYGQDVYEALRRKAYDGVGGKYPASFWQSEHERLRDLLAGVQ